MATKLPALSEAQFQFQVLEAARLHGWHAAHFRRVRVQRRNGSVYYETPVAADGTGWPDLVLVKHRVLFVELKTNVGRLRPEQVQWLDRLTAAGQTVLLWRPRDWDEVVRILSEES